MPRGRIISKSISRSEKVASLSLAGKLLFTWLIPHTDREGRLEADVWKIKDIVPFIDEINPKNIPSLLSDMQGADLIHYYGDGNCKYLQIKDFEKYNTHAKDREAESVIPAPDEVKIKSGVPHEEMPIQVKVKVKAKEKEREITHPPFVSLSEEELKAFYLGYGKATTKLYIDKINDYLASTGKKPYRDYAATIRNWLRKDNVRMIPRQENESVSPDPQQRGERMSPEQFEAWKKSSPEWKKIMGRQ
jgi:hypothetical protein